MRSLQRGNAEAPPAPQGPRAGSCSTDARMVMAPRGCRTQPCIPTATVLLTLCLFFNCMFHFNAILLV